MKQKDVAQNTKTTILDAANRVILEKGAEALTLDAAAKEAGVSKGGLLYHFPTKRKLIEGMIERLILAVESGLSSEMASNGGDFLKAYILVSFAENQEHNRISTALFAAIANQPDLLQPLQLRYRSWQEQAAAAAPSAEIGTLIRLALDGLWISDLLNFAPPAPILREKVLKAILSLAAR